MLLICLLYLLYEIIIKRFVQRRLIFKKFEMNNVPLAEEVNLQSELYNVKN